MSCPSCHATRRETAPNISSYPVAQDILWQAVKNTRGRVIDVVESRMTMQELEEANMELVEWLAETFAGKNEHFECESEFNEVFLPQSLRETIAEAVFAQNPTFDLNDDEALMFNVFAYFVSEIFVLLKEAQAMEGDLQANLQVVAFVDQWTLRVTGAPSASDFRN